MPRSLVPLAIYLHTQLGECSGISFIASTSRAVWHPARIAQHRIFPPPPAPGPDLVLRHFSVEDLALETAARFAALVKLLTDKGALHPDEQRSLLNDDFTSLVDRNTLQSLAWLLLRTADAEAGLQ